MRKSRLPVARCVLLIRDIIGDTAVNFFSRFKADFGIFGVGGIDDDGTLLDFYSGEVQARQAIVANCRTALLVADGSKFGRNATVRAGHINDCHHFFTDKPVPASFHSGCRTSIPATFILLALANQIAPDIEFDQSASQQARRIVFLLGWMIGRDAVAPLGKQQRVAIELHGALHPADENEMIPTPMLGFAAAFEKAATPSRMGAPFAPIDHAMLLNLSPPERPK